VEIFFFCIAVPIKYAKSLRKNKQLETPTFLQIYKTRPNGKFWVEKEDMYGGKKTCGIPVSGKWATVSFNPDHNTVPLPQ
jgi:hypothetical protein